VAHGLRLRAPARPPEQFTEGASEWELALVTPLAPEITIRFVLCRTIDPDQRPRWEVKPQYDDPNGYPGAFLVPTFELVKKPDRWEIEQTPRNRWILVGDMPTACLHAERVYETMLTQRDTLRAHTLLGDS
jgi:hypothetical protein